MASGVMGVIRRPIPPPPRLATAAPRRSTAFRRQRSRGFSPGYSRVPSGLKALFGFRLKPVLRLGLQFTSALAPHSLFHPIPLYPPIPLPSDGCQGPQPGAAIFSDQRACAAGENSRAISEISVHSHTPFSANHPLTIPRPPLTRGFVVKIRLPRPLAYLPRSKRRRQRRKSAGRGLWARRRPSPQGWGISSSTACSIWRGTYIRRWSRLSLSPCRRSPITG